MSDRDERIGRPVANGTTEEAGPALAEVIDAVRWDYDPEDDDVSPLVSTERYFRDFPWDGENPEDGAP